MGKKIVPGRIVKHNNVTVQLYDHILLKASADTHSMDRLRAVKSKRALKFFTSVSGAEYPGFKHSRAEYQNP